MKKDLKHLKTNGPGHEWVEREATWVQKMGGLRAPDPSLLPNALLKGLN